MPLVKGHMELYLYCDNKKIGENVLCKPFFGMGGGVYILLNSHWTKLWFNPINS